MNVSMILALIPAVVGTPEFGTQCDYTRLVVAQWAPAAQVRCLPAQVSAGELLLLQRRLGLAPSDAEEPVPITEESLDRVRTRHRADAAIDALINDEED